MISYLQTLTHFHDAILEKNAAIVRPEIKDNNRVNPHIQLAIYIDGYRLRLMQAIAEDYPAFKKLLGDEEFRRLALQYIEVTPSEHFNLDRYPHSFAEFAIKESGKSFATDIARLESAIAIVFMEEESEPLDASAIIKLSAETFASMRLTPRTASRLMAFDYPVNTWLEEERADKNPPAPQAQKEFLYLYRHNNNVMRAELTEPAYLFLQQLFNDKSVEEALEAVIKIHPQYEEQILGNVQLWFSEWLTKGFFRS
jgi:hypothetical protein